MSKYDVTKIHPALEKITPVYQKIIDCGHGSAAVKEKTTDYLPMPNSLDDSEDNIQRYNDYIDKAIFIGTLKKTTNSLTGLASSKESKIDIIDYLNDNVDGNGLSLEQQIKKVIAEGSSIGRAGLFVDYSNNNGDVSQDDINTGKIRAYITRYDALDIIWPTDNLIVLKESYEKESIDGYTKDVAIQYKVLVMRGGIYSQEIWQANANGQYEPVKELAKTPIDKSNKSFDHIPFYYIGSENNENTFDDPPMETLSDLSIGHYRNSADYEENVFEHGQTTVVSTGLNENWVKKVLGGVLSMGSRGGIPLPVGADAKLLQASPNTLAFEAMKHKEEQMIANGAQMVTQATREKTATQTNRESVTEDSVLLTVVKNTESAYRSALGDVELYTGIPFKEFELNKDFTKPTYDANVAAALLNDYMQGAGQLEDVFNYKVETGMISKDVTFEDWKTNIENTIPLSNADVDD